MTWCNLSIVIHLPQILHYLIKNIARNFLDVTWCQVTQVQTIYCGTTRKPDTTFHVFLFSKWLSQILYQLIKFISLLDKAGVTSLLWINAWSNRFSSLLGAKKTWSGMSWIFSGCSLESALLCLKWIDRKTIAKILNNEYFINFNAKIIYDKLRIKFCSVSWLNPNWHVICIYIFLLLFYHTHDQLYINLTSCHSWQWASPQREEQQRCQRQRSRTWWRCPSGRRSPGSWCPCPARWRGNWECA